MLRRHIGTYTGENADSFIFTSVKSRLLINQYFTPYRKRALAAADVDETTRLHDLYHLDGITSLARTLIR